MPGFKVQGFGGDGRVGSSAGSPPADPAPGSIDVYYSYTWDLINVFESFSPRAGNPLLMLKDATLPTFSAGKEMVAGASLKYKFAKDVTWDDIKLTWYDNVGLINIIRQWRRAVWTQQNGLLGADGYKKLTTLRTWLPSGEADVEWTLVNSWPSSIRYGDLTYTTSDVKLVEVTLTYDWAEENSYGQLFASNSQFAGGSQSGTFPFPPISPSPTPTPPNPGGNSGGFIGIP